MPHALRDLLSFQQKQEFALENDVEETPNNWQNYKINLSNSQISKVRKAYRYLIDGEFDAALDSVLYWSSNMEQDFSTKGEQGILF